jgi:hypothetical protein
VTAASATTASAMAAVPAASAPATAFALRACLVDYERSSEKVFAVERRDGFLGLLIVADLRETEPARLSGESVAKQRE